MANCPKCGVPIKKWDWSANCKKCGVNIMYYDMEAKLDADAKKAEIEIAAFAEKTANMKKTLAGAPLQIIRSVFVFVPLVILVLPIASLNLNIPFVERTSYSLSMFSLFSDGGLGILQSLTGSAVVGGAAKLFLAAVACVAASVVFAVLNFAFTLTGSFGRKFAKSIVCNAAAAVLILGAAGMILSSLGAVSATGIDFINGNLNYIFLIGAALFAFNVVLGIAVRKKVNK